MKLVYSQRWKRLDLHIAEGLRKALWPLTSFIPFSAKALIIVYGANCVQSPGLISVTLVHLIQAIKSLKAHGLKEDHRRKPIKDLLNTIKQRDLDRRREVYMRVNISRSHLTEPQIFQKDAADICRSGVIMSSQTKAGCSINQA